MSSSTGVDEDDSKPDDELMCGDDSEQVNINYSIINHKLLILLIIHGINCAGCT